MGLVLLIGLVVKNGIVLLDYAEHERERGACRRVMPSPTPRASGCGRS